ncbi:MAG: hypothetical protein EOO89_23435 [Pedobacter sp.]|nr:MAG: hypothetical protein EOO89_23435 [Pedobacter sp.]
MNRLFTLAILLACSFSVIAQEKVKKDSKNLKTDVLVVGNNNSAVAAGIQSAISNVNTILLTKENAFNITPLSKNSSGIELTFIKKVRESNKSTDTLAPVTFDDVIANKVISEWTDSLKKLTVIKNSGWNKFERSGGGWQVKLDDGRTIKAGVLVYAMKENLGETVKYDPSEVTTAFDYNSTNYRTSIAGTYIGDKPVFTSMYSLLKPTEENLVVANSSDANMAVGQAAGATAAYAGFFKTKTSASSLKMIRTELLTYKLNLLPFSDVVPTDTNWRAIQAIGITGILKAVINNGEVKFMPDQQVQFAEIKQPLKDNSYKVQLWLDDNPDAPITLENTITIISYLKPETITALKNDIEKKWKTTYQFKSEFDLKSILTRREFAVLLNDKTNLIDVNVDRVGRVLR